MQVLLVCALFGPWVFGVGFGFYRFGPGDGILSVLFPPFGWFRGASFLWTEPKWKEEWDDRTTELGYLLLDFNPGDFERQLRLTEFESEIRSWIVQLPRSERLKLRTHSIALLDCAFDEAQDLLSRVTEAGEVVPFEVESAGNRSCVAQFGAEPGLRRAWDSFHEGAKLEWDRLAAGVDGWQGRDKNKDLTTIFRDNPSIISRAFGVIRAHSDRRIERLFAD